MVGIAGNDNNNSGIHRPEAFGAKLGDTKAAGYTVQAPGTKNADKSTLGANSRNILLDIKPEQNYKLSIGKQSVLLKATSLISPNGKANIDLSKFAGHEINLKGFDPKTHKLADFLQQNSRLAGFTLTDPRQSPPVKVAQQAVAQEEAAQEELTQEKATQQKASQTAQTKRNAQGEASVPTSAPSKARPNTPQRQDSQAVGRPSQDQAAEPEKGARRKRKPKGSGKHSARVRVRNNSQPPLTQLPPKTQRKLQKAGDLRFRQTQLDSTIAEGDEEAFERQDFDSVGKGGRLGRVQVSDNGANSQVQGRASALSDNANQSTNDIRKKPVTSSKLVSQNLSVDSQTPLSRAAKAVVKAEQLHQEVLEAFGKDAKETLETERLLDEAKKLYDELAGTQQKATGGFALSRVAKNAAITHDIRADSPDKSKRQNRIALTAITRFAKAVGRLTSAGKAAVAPLGVRHGPWSSKLASNQLTPLELPLEGRPLERLPIEDGEFA
jgi:hypothetical protein